MEYSGKVINTTTEVSVGLSELDEWYFGDLTQTQTELDEYLSTSVLRLRGVERETFNPIAWYKANDRSYPTMAMIAYNVFAVPAMSAEAERIFSR